MGRSVRREVGQDSDLTAIRRRVASLEKQVAELRRTLAADDGASDQSRAELLHDLVVDEKFRVRLDRLVMGAAREVVEKMTSDDLLVTGTAFSEEELRRRVTGLSAAAMPLIPVVVEGAYWGSSWVAPVWRRAIERIAIQGESASGIVIWLRLRLLPALITSYAVGVGAVSAGRYEHLASEFGARIREVSRTLTTTTALYPENVLEQRAARLLEGMDRRHTPLSDYLFEFLRPYMTEFVPDSIDYELAFDRYEFLLGLSHAFERGSGWGPVGRFGWRRRGFPQDDIVETVGAEIEQQAERWPPLQAGMFGGDLTKLKETFRTYREIVDRVGLQWF
jgi:hypothetical protein